MAIAEGSVGYQAPTVRAGMGANTVRYIREEEGRGLHQIGSKFQGMHIVAAARIAGTVRENIGRDE
jgi:hypothetical protein